jgi:hypothetical protein
MRTWLFFRHFDLLVLSVLSGLSGLSGHLLTLGHSAATILSCLRLLLGLRRVVEHRRHCSFLQTPDRLTGELRQSRETLNRNLEVICDESISFTNYFTV